MMASLLLLAMLAAQVENVEVEPVTCWWRTSTAAVRIGEPFDVVLTCSFLQTEAARVIADESRLEPSVVQLQPFDVIGGSRAQDVSTAGRRFVQFQYRLRAVAENAFAAEAAVPAVEISYRVEARVSGGESLAGRDLTYALPPLTMRVLSLVPDTAEDIREAPIATFEAIDDYQSRGTLFRLGAAVAFALGGLVLALALIRVLRSRRSSERGAPRLPGPGAVLRSVRAELTAVQDEVRAGGWTADLVGRTLAALRIVAAYAAGQPVAQRLGSERGMASDGELRVNRRGGGAAAVSAAVTTVEDEELRRAMALLSSARYGRNALPETTREGASDPQLDDALDVVVRRVDRLAGERSWTERLWPR
jgi:hypothetical protein